MYLIVSVLAVWTGYLYLFLQHPNLANQEAMKSKLTSELKDSKQQYGNLKQQIKELHNDNYISFLAQKKYDLVKPGQILFNSN